jgi:hypothetical protein
LPDWPFFHWPLCLGAALSVISAANIVIRFYHRGLLP